MDNRHGGTGGDNGFANDASNMARKRFKQADKENVGCRVSGKASTKTKGVLSSFATALPLELVTAIFSYLEPLDILHLSWSSNALHSLLVSLPFSALVWKTARANIPGLPELPTDMTESDYAKLVFANICTFCGKTSTRKIEWYLRCRVCRRCAKEELEETLCSLDFEILSGNPRRRCADITDDRHLLMHRPSTGNRIVVRRGAKERLKDIFDKLLPDTAEAREARKIQRVEKVAAILNYTNICKRWYDNRIAERSAELEVMRVRRREAIVVKLNELGWADEIASMTPSVTRKFDHHNCVRTTTNLTDKNWDNIRGDLVQFMEAARAERLMRERKPLMKARKEMAARGLNAWKIARLRRFGGLEVLPSAADFAQCAPVATIIEGPTTLEVTPISFRLVLQSMDALLPLWYHEINVKLFRHVFALASGRGLWAAKEAVRAEVTMTTLTPMEQRTCAYLKLATTVLKCWRCDDRVRGHPHPHPNDPVYEASNDVLGTPRWFPQVLGHKCLFAPNLPMVYGIQETQVNSHAPWSPSLIRLDPVMSQLATYFVEICGGDPRTTTAAEMDALPVRFACGVCGQRMKWRGAVEHHVAHPKRRVPWRTCEPWEVPEIMQLEAALAANMPQWACVYCVDLPEEIEPDFAIDVKKHVRQAHLVALPRMGIDYFRIAERAVVAVEA